MMNDKKLVFKFDCATAMSMGGRDYQEDATISDFSNGADIGFTILSDGMGGHAAGDIASKIVVTRIFSELTFQRDRIISDPDKVTTVLHAAALTANEALKCHVIAHPETADMGATLVACVVVQNRLYWISIGDSPLFLFRDNVLHRLNEDHSLGPHIDLMVRSGAMTAEVGEAHPDRNILTSVLAGQASLTQIDCPEMPFELKATDTIIVASDGLQYLRNEAISKVLRDRPMAQSVDIASALMSKLDDLGDPDLDNVALSLIQVQAPSHDRMASHPVSLGKMDVVPKVRWRFAAGEAAMKVARRARARIETFHGRPTDGA